MRNKLILLAIGAAALVGYLMTRGSTDPEKPGDSPAMSEPTEADTPTAQPSRFERRVPPTLPPQPEAPTFRRMGGGNRQDDGTRDERRRERLQRFDTNGDGQLDEAERAALREGRVERRRARTLESFDDDGDGALNDDEQAMLDRARKDMTADRAARMIRGVDADQDGKISRAEAEAGGGRMQRLLSDFDRVDRDGDGLISDEEMQKEIGERRGRRGRRDGEQQQQPDNGP